MRLRSVLGAVVVVATALSGCGPAVETTGRTNGQGAGFVTSGDCPRERALVRRALDRSDLRADVNGDGRPDRVAVVSDFKAPKPCRAFVGVRVKGGSTYSTHLIPEAAPLKGLQAKVVGLPRLGDGRRAQVVVDTKAAVDSLLAQMFALAGGRLRSVEVPGFEDGTFIVEGGGVVYPHGAACTADGRMVLARAAQTKDGKSYRVTRRTFDVRGKRVRLVDPVVDRATLPVNLLVTRFPEFAGPHWKACGGVAGLPSA
jgi:hypothetical protein